MHLKLKMSGLFKCPVLKLIYVSGNQPAQELTSTGSLSKCNNGQNWASPKIGAKNSGWVAHVGG